MDGVHRHHPDVWEPTGEVFDKRAVVVSDHVENRQVDEVLGGEGIENINRVQHGEVPDDEGSKAGEVNRIETDIDDIGIINPLRARSIQRELAQLGAAPQHVTKIVDRGTSVERYPPHV